MNRFFTFALGVALTATLASTASFAGSDEAMLSAPLTTVAATATATATPPPAGRSRAEVVAEMQAAQARGELQAGHAWGIDVPPVRNSSSRLRIAAASGSASR